MTIETETLLRERLQTLAPTFLDLEDESHLHAGHAGNTAGASHFRVYIEAPCFEGHRTVAQHRLVYDLLSDLIPFPIHALALKTSIPSKGHS